MKYAYEDLGPEQFENLVVAICQFVLGAGVQGFAKGIDGGRDAKFVGTAQLHPSTTDPWKGTSIVQAKHTNGYNKTFSDADFYSQGNDDTVLGAELPRIQKLKAASQLDHYMLFSNRKLTGNAESKLRSIIAKECGLSEYSIYLGGVEQLELWLKRFPAAATIADIDPVDSPLLVSPDELAEIVEALGKQIAGLAQALPSPGERISYERKNQLNNMSNDYARTLRRLYLKETAQIKSFLAAPENAELLKLYESVVDEFQQKILAKRKDYQSFDEVMIYLRDLLFDRDPILRAHKRLTSTMLFYMYWNCDVGITDDAAP
jgi:ABC-3C protein